MTPEEKQKDFADRKDKWLEKYKGLMSEFKIDIFCQPQFVPDGKGGFIIAVRQDLVDLADQAVPSKAEDFL